MSLTMRAMKAATFKVNRSKHDFEQTVKRVCENALPVGWDVPWRFSNSRKRWLKSIGAAVCDSLATRCFHLPRGFGPLARPRAGRQLGRQSARNAELVLSTEGEVPRPEPPRRLSGALLSSNFSWARARKVGRRRQVFSYVGTCVLGLYCTAIARSPTGVGSHT